MNHGSSIDVRMSRSFAPSLTLLALLGAMAAPTAARAQNYDVTAFNQRDGRWSNQRLGNSNLTIGSDGCLVTSIAMIYTSWGQRTDPPSVNSLLRSRGAFSGPLVVWGNTPGYAGMLDYRTRPADIGTIRSYLNQGYRLTVETRMGSTRQYSHWVVVRGVTASGDLMTVDPWYGDRLLFSSRFGDPKRWVYRVALFR